MIVLKLRGWRHIKRCFFFHITRLFYIDYRWGKVLMTYGEFKLLRIQYSIWKQKIRSKWLGNLHLLGVIFVGKLANKKLILIWNLQSTYWGWAWAWSWGWAWGYIYHGVLYPHLVWVLSDNIPTIIHANASTIWPVRKDMEAIEGRFLIYFV